MPIYLPSSGGGGTSGTASPPFSIVQYQEYCAAASSITFGATATANNTLLGIVSTDSADTVTTPSGWSLLTSKSQASFAQLLVYIKTAAGTETSVSFSGANTGNNPTCAFLEISGTHTADQSATSGKVPGITTCAYAQPPAITPSNGAMVFAAAAYVPNAYSSPESLMGNGNWQVLTCQTTSTATRHLALFLYLGSGAGSSLTPPLFSTAPMYSSAAGIAMATFSIK